MLTPLKRRGACGINKKMRSIIVVGPVNLEAYTLSPN
jgi:hypothetical protein